MKKVFFPNEIKEIELKMMEQYHLKSSDLIDNAVHNLLSHFIERFPTMDPLISAVIGPGNNGSDGLGLAQRLIELGYSVEILSVGRRDNCKSIDYESQKIRFQNRIKRSEIIIDAIFGIGLRGELQGNFLNVVGLINQSQAEVISIDIPSGLDSFSGLVLGNAVKADQTWVIGAWKTGLLMNQGMDYTGECFLIEVAIDYDLVENTKYIYPCEIQLKKRKHFSNKYDYGNVLTVGGTQGYFGAPTLSAIAALRAGCGISRIALNTMDYPFYTQIYPELVIERYHDVNEIRQITNKIDAYAFGPGIKKDELTKRILEYLVSLQKPVVVDASGIEMLDITKNYSGNIIITPHLGELIRLTGLTKDDLLKNPFSALKEISHHGVITLLKGPTTVIEFGDKTILLPYGSPGMATAGMGDLLTGLILSFLGQGYSIEKSVLNGSILHIESSLLAIEHTGEESFIASDLLNYIGLALKKVGKYET